MENKNSTVLAKSNSFTKMCSERLFHRANLQFWNVLDQLKMKVALTLSVLLLCSKNEYCWDL